MNEYINLTLENIEKEHICCAIGDPKQQVIAKYIDKFYYRNAFLSCIGNYFNPFRSIY